MGRGGGCKASVHFHLVSILKRLINLFTPSWSGERKRTGCKLKKMSKIPNMPRNFLKSWN